MAAAPTAATASAAEAHSCGRRRSAHVGRGAGQVPGRRGVHVAAEEFEVEVRRRQDIDRRLISDVVRRMPAVAAAHLRRCAVAGRVAFCFGCCLARGALRHAAETVSVVGQCKVIKPSADDCTKAWGRCVAHCRSKAKGRVSVEITKPQLHMNTAEFCFAGMAHCRSRPSSSAPRRSIQRLQTERSCHPTTPLEAPGPTVVAVVVGCLRTRRSLCRQQCRQQVACTGRPRCCKCPCSSGMPRSR